MICEPRWSTLAGSVLAAAVCSVSSPPGAALLRPLPLAVPAATCLPAEALVRGASLEQHPAPPVGAHRQPLWEVGIGHVIVGMLFDPTSQPARGVDASLWNGWRCGGRHGSIGSRPAYRGWVMNLFDPTQWAETLGWVKLVGVCLGTFVLVAVKLAGSRRAEWFEQQVSSRVADDGVPFETRWRTRI